MGRIKGVPLPGRGRCKSILGWSRRSIGPAYPSAMSLCQRSEVVALLRHELRTPLTGLLGVCSLLGDTRLTAEQEHLLRAVSASGQQLNRLVERLTNFESSSVLNRAERPVPVNVLQLLESVVQAHWSAAREKGLELFLVFDCRLSQYWMCDETGLRQLADNLLANAIRFTRNGHVLLEALPGPQGGNGQGGVMLRVSDTGIGICTEDNDHIYKVNERGLANPYHDPAGSGLGLFVCRELAAAMGGTIEHDPYKQKGTTFKITLPGITLAPDPTSMPSQPALLSRRTCLIGMKEPVAAVTRQAVERMGMRVTQAVRKEFEEQMGAFDFVMCESGWLSQKSTTMNGDLAAGRPILLCPQKPASKASKEKSTYVSWLLPQPMLFSGLRALVLNLVLERIFDLESRHSGPMSGGTVF